MRNTFIFSVLFGYLLVQFVFLTMGIKDSQSCGIMLYSPSKIQIFLNHQPGYIGGWKLGVGSNCDFQRPVDNAVEP